MKLMKDKKRLLNDEIRASKIKLIDNEWELIWEMSLQEAKQKAQELWLDLMQLWEASGLTIVKLLDYWKFLYKQKKQEQKSKQAGKAPDIKTIKITFKIWEHDLEVKRNQAEKFAKAWHPLKVILQLRWRENQYEKIAYEKIESFIAMLEEFYKIDKKLVKNWSNFLVTMLPK